ncbi:MAG: hypothetical protein ACXVAY_04440 [Mucilaginibacter sp.]
MSDTKERKISYITLFKKKWENQGSENFPEISKLIGFIGKKKKLERQMDFQDSKFCFLDTFTITKDGVISGFFSSAKHKFRPNLLDQKTGEERLSPKKISEGEKEKTHFVIKICKEETFLILEQNGNGVSAIQVASYLNKFLKEYLKTIHVARDFSIDLLKVGRDNFLEILSDMKRVRTAEIFLDKSLLGNKFLNFSNRIIPLQNNLILTATAEAAESIKEAAIDIFNASNKDNSVSRVRIKGIDTKGTSITLDTTFIEKVDSLKINLNPTTGEIETTEMISGLIALAKSLE